MIVPQICSIKDFELLVEKTGFLLFINVENTFIVISCLLNKRHDLLATDIKLASILPASWRHRPDKIQMSRNNSDVKLKHLTQMKKNYFACFLSTILI